MLSAKSHISKWGTSLAIRIPKAIAEQWGVQEGAIIEIEPRGSEILLRKKKYDLDEMLAQVTSEDLHLEEEWGTAQGREEW